MSNAIRSYTSLHQGLRGRVREIIDLYKQKSAHGPEHFRFMVGRMRQAEELIRSEGGLVGDNLRILEIGPGQKQRTMLYFHSRGHRVEGIDLNEIVRGFDLLGYARMWRHNGSMRVIKTLGRKAAGLDRMYFKHLGSELGLESIPVLPVRQMDAARMSFADGEFDLVYSTSVFEHLPTPDAAVAECARVVRPGGCAYISLHLYTSDTGCHDQRIMEKRDPAIPSWSHLRPEHAHKVNSNAYLNKIRLPQWKELFERHMPGVRLHHMQYDNAHLRPILDELRKAGELAEYSDDELLTVDLVAIWKKPGGKGAE